MGKLVIEDWQVPEYLDVGEMMNSWAKGCSRRGTKIGCSICGDPIHVAGVCQAHYRDARTIEGFVRTHGLVECAFDGCEMIRANYMLCYGHYGQIKKGRELKPIKRDWGTGTHLGKCLVPHCERDALDYDAPICKPHRRSVWKYGITLEELVELYARGECQVCGETKRLHIDHDHSCCPSLANSSQACGKCVRGILCGNCNLSIGNAKESPQTLRALADYLESGERV